MESATLIGGPVCPDVSGGFTVTLNTPLVRGHFIFGFDTCTGLMGPLFPVPLVPPNPVPTVSSGMIAVLAGTLALVGLFGLLRLRRDL